MKWKTSLAVLFCFGAQAQAISCGPNRDYIHGPQGVNLWKLDPSRSAQNSRLFVHDSQSRIHPNFEDRASDKSPGDFRVQKFQQPVDHFDSKSQTVFYQRYWVNARHYQPRKGAPVIVFDGGEGNGEDRLPLLDTGIVEILARATNGIGIVLEHRYYGESLPVNNFSTDALRFLNNEQAVEDSVNFMKNVKLDGIHEDMTAPGTPWIYYGGSYAGARAAHMKVLHPDIVWGAIASSGVIHATLRNWRYFDMIREAADPKCSDDILNSISTIDDILSDSPSFKPQLKNVFGLEDLEHDVDFVSILMTPLWNWQYKNWDPNVGTTGFEDFCKSLDLPVGRVSVADMGLPFGHPKRMVPIGQDFALDIVIVNYSKWIKEHSVSSCNLTISTIEKCFGSFDDSQYQGTGIDQDWRPWTFQFCTQWGFFYTAPPDQNIPRIVSRLLTLESQSKICKQAFPPGEYFSVPPLPNITAVNALGGFDIAADRLAFIDGEIDPWRSDTAHSDEAYDREDTILRPFKLIPNGVHHYDINGLKNIGDEPLEIRKIHEEIMGFVKSWLKDWDAEHGIEE